MKRSYLAICIILCILFIDQALKIWVKTTFQYSEEIHILGFEWARLHFIENDGMAFGLKIGGEYGKLLLTIFRIVAVVLIGFYLRTLIKEKISKSLIVSIAFIFAGAVGNIIDSVFYGMIFDKGLLIDFELGRSIAYTGVAEFNTNGYSTFLHGNVVDMFYFPFIEGYYPAWFPIKGGDYFAFFRPIFNIADSAISIGVLSILLFNRSVFKEKKKIEETDQTPSDSAGFSR